MSDNEFLFTEIFRYEFRDDIDNLYDCMYIIFEEIMSLPENEIPDYIRGMESVFYSARNVGITFSQALFMIGRIDDVFNKHGYPLMSKKIKNIISDEKLISSLGHSIPSEYAYKMVLKLKLANGK